MAPFDLTLGARLGGGGEGEVFELAHHAGFAAKVYLSRPSEVKRAHLEHLIARTTPELACVAAWPQSLQTDAKGQLILVLPAIARPREIHEFYGVASRIEHWPTATWADCVHVALHVAKAVAEVHAAGFIVADLNEQNFLVDPFGNTTLIDCDSLMSTHEGRRTFGGAFRPEWLPPELAGRSDLSAVERTPNHDNFSLAMMMFRLLMLGRHPFTGAPLSGAAMPTDSEAIETHQFVYAGMSKTMALPDGAPSFHVLPPPLRAQFVDAFGPQGRTERPTAADWVVNLQRLQHRLMSCDAGAEHRYSNHLSDCPWCALAPRCDAFPIAERDAIDAARPDRGLSLAEASVSADAHIVRFGWRTHVQLMCIAMTLICTGGLWWFMTPIA